MQLRFSERAWIHNASWISVDYSEVNSHCLALCLDAGLGHNFVLENHVHSCWPKFWVQSMGLGFSQNSLYS